MKPELLSPAGSPEALRAAVENGAGAVYLGWGEFNARRGAKNFTDEEFADALIYCHERGVRVFLTLNTLLTDRELPAALETARTACRLGVDAILVQDWGLFDLLRRALPDLPLHASTQMSLFTSGGACEAAADGCERVVIARECSGEETAEICRRCPAEVEIFGHGALCMCYSGQCEMSALIGGRSGNRGTCAQPCRMRYDVVPLSSWEDDPAAAKATRAEGGRTLCPVDDAPPPAAGKPVPGNQRPLSLKDSCLANRLTEAEAMGVSCLKLEGRMKRPEYVAVITGIYATLLREGRGPTAEEQRALEQAFSRSGFTDAYWRGRHGAAMLGARPENAPEPKELFAAAKAAYDRGGMRTVPVDFFCAILAGEPCTLTAVDQDGHTVTVTGPVPEAARSRALTEEDLRDRLGKTGGTAYRCREVSVTLDEGLSLPASAVNALRREALTALTAARTAPPPRRELPLPPEVADTCAAPEPRLTVSVTTAAQLTGGLLDLSPARVYVPLELLRDFPALPEGETEWFAVLPRVWRDRDEERLSQWLDHAIALGVTGAAVGNLGHLPLVRNRGLTLAGDFGMNVFNSRSLDYLKGKGLTSACVSFELRFAQIRDLHKPLPTEAMVYGRLPVMITENCLLQNTVGCRCDRANVLVDRTGAAFPILPAFGHRTELQNSRPLWLADRPDWRRLGLTYARLRFTTESPEECVRVFRAYQTGGAPAGPFTRGLYERGVE